MGDNRSQSCDSREWGSVPRRPHRAGFLGLLASPAHFVSLTIWAAGSRRAEPGSAGLTTLAADPALAAPRAVPDVLSRRRALGSLASPAQSRQLR